MNTRAPILSQLVRLAAPIVGLNLLSVAALAVDTAMCGRLGSADVALTGLGYAVQLIFLLLVFMIGLTVGTVSLISRAFGAKDEPRIHHVLWQSTQLTILLAGVVSVIGITVAPMLLGALGATDQAADAAMEYLTPLLSGTVFYYLNILLGASMRAVGNTRLPFQAALVANFLNVVLNYCLILGHFGFPALGLQGAAIGTLASQAVNTLLLIAAIRLGKLPSLSLTFALRPIDRALGRELYRVGLPAAMDMVVLNAGFLSLVTFVSAIDEIAVAAQGVGLRVQALAFVPGLGISQATAAMVGQALGGEEPDRAKQVAKWALALCSLVMTTLAVVFVFLAGPIASLFDVAPGGKMEAYTIEWIRILGAGMFPVGLYIAVNGVLSGAGATHISLRINALSTFGLQIPLAAFLGMPFGLDLGLTGIWASFPLSYLVKAGLGLWVLQRGRWAVTGLRPEIAQAPLPQTQEQIPDADVEVASE